GCTAHGFTSSYRWQALSTVWQLAVFFSLGLRTGCLLSVDSRTFSATNFSDGTLIRMFRSGLVENAEQGLGCGWRWHFPVAHDLFCGKVLTVERLVAIAIRAHG